MLHRCLLKMCGGLAPETPAGRWAPGLRAEASRWIAHDAGRPPECGRDRRLPGRCRHEEGGSAPRLLQQAQHGRVRRNRIQLHECAGAGAGAEPAARCRFPVAEIEAALFQWGFGDTAYRWTLGVHLSRSRCQESGWWRTLPSSPPSCPFATVSRHCASTGIVAVLTQREGERE